MRTRAGLALSLALTLTMLLGGPVLAAGSAGSRVSWTEGSSNHTPGGGGGHRRDSVITWSPTYLVFHLTADQSASAEVSVESSVAITTATYASRPHAMPSPVLTGLPASLSANTPVTVEVQVTAPTTRTPDAAASVVVESNGLPLSEPLSVLILPPPPHITWSSGRVARLTVAAGTTATLPITVESSAALTDVSFNTVMRPNQVTLAVSGAPDALAADTPTAVTLVVAVPANARGFSAAGGVAVATGQTIVPAVLPVMVTITGGCGWGGHHGPNHGCGHGPGGPGGNH